MADYVVFKEIKEKVTLRMVLDRYGVPLRKAGPQKLRGKCPLPSHSSDDSKESFIATLDKGSGGVWSCHSQSCAAARNGKLGGNVLDFVAAKEQCSVRDAAIKLQTWFIVPAAGGKPSAEQKPHKNSSAAVVEQKPVSNESDGAGESGANKILDFTLEVNPAHPYLAERGIDEETARQFGIGHYLSKKRPGIMHGRMIIPLHNAQGELIAYAGRAIDGSEPRYKFPAGFRKSLELYNLHRVKGEPSVVVVEGFFDCLRVSQAGYPCVALMGSSMSQAQEKLLAEHFGLVILMLDGDEAGRGATEDIADRLQRSVYQVKTIELDDGVQPDQLRPEEIQHTLNLII